MCFNPEKSKKMDVEFNARDVEFVPCNALNGSTQEFSKKMLESINSLKFDKLTYQLSSVTKSQWIDAFFQSITKKQVISSIKTYLQTQKENLFDEVNPTIIQLE